MRCKNKKAFQSKADHPFSSRPASRKGERRAHGEVQMNKFRGVPVRWGPHVGSRLWLELGGRGRGYQVNKFKHVQVVITWGPRCGETDRHDWKHYLLATSLTGGNKAVQKSAVDPMFLVYIFYFLLYPTLLTALSTVSRYYQQPDPFVVTFNFSCGKNIWLNMFLHHHILWSGSPSFQAISSLLRSLAGHDPSWEIEEKLGSDSFTRWLVWDTSAGDEKVFSSPLPESA